MSRFGRPRWASGFLGAIGAASWLFSSAPLAGAASPTSPSEPATCSAGALRLDPGIIRGAPRGALSVGISVRNISRRPCQLARLATSVAVVPHATGRPYATTHLATSDSVKLAPGHRATSSLVWSGWCGGGVTQWGVRLRFSPKGRSLYALVIGNVAPGSMGSLVPPVPTCRHGGSHVTMAPLVAPAGGVRTT